MTVETKAKLQHKGLSSATADKLELLGLLTPAQIKAKTSQELRALDLSSEEVLEIDAIWTLAGGEQ